MPGVTGARGWSGKISKRWESGLREHVIALAVSPDSSLVAAAPSTGNAVVIDMQGGSPVASLPDQGDGTLCLGWDSSGRHLAAGGKDGSLLIFRDRDWANPVRVCPGGAWVESVAWHAVTGHVASASGKRVAVWSEAGDAVARFPDHPSTVSAIAWRPRSDTLAAAAYGGISLWSISHPASPRLFAWKGSPLSLAWSADGSMLAHGNQDSTVHFWYALSGEDLQMTGYERKVREIDWSPSGHFLATGGGPAICIWNCGRKGGPAGSTPLMLSCHESHLNLVRYQPTGGYLAAGGSDGRLSLWSVSSSPKKPSAVHDFRGSEVTALSWSARGEALVAGGSSGEICLLRVA
jgi:WD40 repeat protein